MKKSILVVIGAMLMCACQKADVNRELQRAASKTKEIKFFNEKEKLLPRTNGGIMFKPRTGSPLHKLVIERGMQHVRTKTMERTGGQGYYKVLVQDEKETLRQLKNHPDVEWADINSTHTTQTVPGDPYWSDSSLWGLKHIGMESVWASGNHGNKTVYVAVIDEGIFSHDDLCGNIWKNPYEIDNGIDDDGNGYIDDFHGWNWFDGNNQIYMGVDDHGTHVAGTIGAKGGNNIGVVGVNSNVVMISCKFLNNYGFDDHAVQAIDYLIDLKQRHGLNIKVLSNSWGGGGYNQGLFEAIQRARDADMLFVAAAGNSNNNNDINPFYPASYASDNVISVGASDWGNNKAAFSHYGPNSVHIFAPGTGIVSTIPSSQHTSAYAFYSGTSMATPHVSGAAALYAGIHTDASYLQIKQSLLSSASKLPQLVGYCQDGNFLNVSTFLGQTDENQSPFFDCPVITPDGTPPTVPQNLDVYEVGFDPNPGPFYGGYAAVKWGRSTDPEGGPVNYYVWINGAPHWTVGGNDYVFAGYTDTTIDYVYMVQSYDAWGNTSNFSNSDTASWNQGIPDTQPPVLNGNPTTSNITQTSITVNWPAASDNVGVTGYSLYRDGLLISSQIGNSYTDNNLTPATIYAYHYTAKDATGNVSVPSGTVSATTLEDTPPPPTCNINSTLNATSQALNVTLNWSNTITGTCTISSTRLERRKGSGSYSVIAFDPNTPYHDNVPTPGNYTYRLAIQSSTGQTFFSNEKSIKVSKK